MALDEYGKYIQQEALAAPQRSSARGGRQSPTAVSVGRRSLIASFIRLLSQMLVLHSGKCGNLPVSLPAQDVGSSEAIAYRVALPCDFPLIFLDFDQILLVDAPAAIERDEWESLFRHICVPSPTLLSI
jgi:hypothetical protein